MKVVEEYLGKRVLFSGDKDGNVWVNDKGTEFEDGSPVSIDDIIGILRCCRREPTSVNSWIKLRRAEFSIRERKKESCTDSVSFTVVRPAEMNGYWKRMIFRAIPSGM